MKKSFTLIETLVAISILAIGILGVFSLISSQISSIHYSENRLIASYLAQEGIEIIRNIRDKNWLNNLDWDYQIAQATDYRLDYQSQKFPDTNYSSCNPLKFDGNFYNCSSGTNTPFQRQISISKSGDEMTVRVTVSWQEKGKTYQHSIAGKLYNWRK